MINRVGITGSRHGCSPEASERLRKALEVFTPEWLHHGDCVGVDEYANGLAFSLGIKTVAHPPSDSSKRAFCNSDEVRPTDGYLERNKAIARASDIVIALPTPDSKGTWHCAKFAKSIGKSVYVIRPDGTGYKL